MHIILASASPRRKELLSTFLQITKVIPADINEVPHTQEPALQFVERMAREKAQQSAMLYRQQSQEEALIIAGDTIVVLQDEILGKPDSEVHAFEMLKKLSGQKHIVMSAFSIADQKGTLLLTKVTQANVAFKALSDQQIKAYIATKEPLDKAGAYGIQGKGAALIESIEGSFYSIMGLDVIALFDALLPFHVIQSAYPALIKGYFQINERIKQAWFKSSDRQSIQLVGVSKLQELDKIKQMLPLGLEHFGENYQQEWTGKYEALKNECPQIKWHFIGQIQSNKAKKIGEAAHFVHGVFKEEQANRLDQGATQQNRKIKIFVQLNLSAEESKGGIQAHELSAFLTKLKHYQSIEVIGLMTFPPEGDAQSSRPYFKQLKQLLQEHQSADLPFFKELSMGVSHDFEVAIEEGATFVRVGSALFGERKK